MASQKLNTNCSHKQSVFWGEHNPVKHLCKCWNETGRFCRMILVVFTCISPSHFPLGAQEQPVKASASRQSVALSTRIMGQIPPV
jgi:hypothetical protein